MLTERMQILVRAHPAGMVATVNEDGTPAVSPKGTFVVLSSESLAFGNIRSPGTIRNLWRRPEIEVCFLDVLERVAVRIRGVATIKRRADCGLDLLSEFETAWPEIRVQNGGYRDDRGRIRATDPFTGLRHRLRCGRSAQGELRPAAQTVRERRRLGKWRLKDICAAVGPGGLRFPTRISNV